MTDTAIKLSEHRKKRFADFAKEPKILDGAKMRIDDILNSEIEIIGYRVAKSKYTKNKSGECLTLQFIDNGGERKVLFTGSDVLIDQMNKYKSEIPFTATIKRVDRYYILT